MSREIRRVPIGWKHPTEPNPYWASQAIGRRRRGKPDPKLHRVEEWFVALQSPSLKVAQAEWDAEYAQWAAGTHDGLGFYRSYHSKSGFVDRDGGRSFNPIRLHHWSDDGNEVTRTEEFWVEDVDVTERRFFEDHHWSRPEDSEAAGRMPDFNIPEDQLGWCLYQTVSEGTPVTPVFATAEGLVDHLCTVGQDYDQEPMRRDVAEALVGAGWCPSGVSVGGAFYEGPESLLIMKAAEPGGADHA